MLAGIRTGKKKQKTGNGATASPAASSGDRAGSVSPAAASPPPPRFTANHDVRLHPTDDNRAAADRLRQAFAAGTGVAPPPRSFAAASFPPGDRVPDTSSPGAGGVIRVSATYAKKDDMTIAEMVAEEKAAATSLLDQEARSLLRQSRRSKRKSLDRFRGRGDDDDDDDVDTNKVYVGEEATDKARQRQLHRHQAEHRNLERMLGLGNRCRWWVRSPSFDRSRLLAVGQYASLVVAPRDASLVPFEHLYVVPIEHVESLAAADSNVWQEIHKFQSTLRKLFRKRNKDVVCFETFLPRKGGYQPARLECVALPIDGAWHDAPLHFRAALKELASDDNRDGAYAKIRPTHTVQRPLSRTVPSNGKFPYVYVQYDACEGVAQLIEDPTSFPNDFALDVLAGLLRQDPMRFRRPPSSSKRHPSSSSSSAGNDDGNDAERAGMRDLRRRWDALDDDRSERGRAAADGTTTAAP